MRKSLLRPAAMSVAILVSFGAVSDQAQAAFCVQPRAPTFFGTKPSRPYCAPNCSEMQVQFYKSELEDFFRRLKQYAQDVDEYYRDADEYITCMAKSD